MSYLICVFDVVCECAQSAVDNALEVYSSIRSRY